MYTVFHPVGCEESETNLEECIPPDCSCEKDNVTIEIFYGLQSRPSAASLKSESHRQVLAKLNWKCGESFEESLLLPLPKKLSETWLHIFSICQKHIDRGEAIYGSNLASYSVSRIGSMLSEKSEKNLVGVEDEVGFVFLPHFSRIYLSHQLQPTPKKAQKENKPILHLHKHARFHLMLTDFILNVTDPPRELIRSLNLRNMVTTWGSEKVYLPIQYADELSRKRDDYLSVRKLAEEENKVVNFTILYSPISIGALRMLITLEHTFILMKDFGFTATDMEDIASIFYDTNFVLVALTMVISMLHLILDFLSFKKRYPVLEDERHGGVEPRVEFEDDNLEDFQRDYYCVVFGGGEGVVFGADAGECVVFRRGLEDDESVEGLSTENEEERDFGVY